MSMRVTTRPPSHAREPERRVEAHKGRIRLARVDLKFSPYAYVAPFFVIFGIFGLYPLVYTFWVSLHQWPPGSIDHPWLGLGNYTELFKDGEFWNATENTVGMLIVSSVPQLALALVLANALNRRIRFRGFMRMAIAVPIITSTAAVALIFAQLYSRDSGIINWLLNLDNYEWQAHRLPSWFAISTMVNWRWTGYNALIYLAAMQAIPKDLYESAELDGASRMRQFWQITVPMIRPTIIFTVIISTIGGMQLFTEPLLFQGGSGSISGGSMGQFQTVNMYMIQTMFDRARFGYASAIAWMLFLIIVIFVIINSLITRRISSAEK